ncbi:MAG: metal-binding protein [Oscillospiraceae bacterium]|nr:metal-binding protein [Oscillospiraceae bacterium]
MENCSKFFKNKDCQYYPCHNVDSDINCLFCFCPLYQHENCPGTPQYIIANGKQIKDCSGCLYPHKPENYDNIIKLLSE